MNNTPSVFLYVALPCEAKPIVEHFDLKKQTNYPSFAIFSNENICLTISGLGKTAMAAAVAYSYALLGNSVNAVFLNIGIAGHKTHTLGKIFCVDKITDVDSNKNFYPQLTANIPCPTLPLITVSKASCLYRENYLHDMEASSFFETAIRFTSSELIQCLKIVSDNENSGIEHINPSQATQLVNTSISSLEKLILELSKLAAKVNPVKENLYALLEDRWRLSSSNRRKLKILLFNWQIITDYSDIPIELLNSKNGKEFLLRLEKALEQWGCYSL